MTDDADLDAVLWGIPIVYDEEVPAGYLKFMQPINAGPIKASRFTVEDLRRALENVGASRQAKALRVAKALIEFNFRYPREFRDSLSADDRDIAALMLTAILADDGVHPLLAKAFVRVKKAREAWHPPFTTLTEC